MATPPRSASLAALFIALCLWAAPCAAAQTLPLPPPLDGVLDVILGLPPSLAPGNALTSPASPGSPSQPGARAAKIGTPQNILPLFCNIPYRLDGAINDTGQYATFNAPETILITPGLNCSGFVLAACRVLLGKNIPLAAAARDRLQDSGPESPHGHDWDFGFDLIMNIAENAPSRILRPDDTPLPSPLSGKNVPFFDPQDPNFPENLFRQMRESAIYPVSFSRRKTPTGPLRSHYHTAICIREGKALWFYSTTRQSGKVIRRNLREPQDLAAFRAAFRSTPNSLKGLTILEVNRPW